MSSPIAGIYAIFREPTHALLAASLASEGAEFLSALAEHSASHDVPIIPCFGVSWGRLATGGNEQAIGEPLNQAGKCAKSVANSLCEEVRDHDAKASPTINVVPSLAERLSGHWRETLGVKSVMGDIPFFRADRSQLASRHFRVK